ncbi:hypothetical protein BDP27DRAFT_1046880 [Rhodocollybia butyracea]|uniref:Uncharacterized protein n=1 Tax=Rhodocollybia butyracea TaxID=206335 RepID=A0A9P5PIA9_9AGAR|nr:hypothetical protein BDP27DRAFT_1046880 [Rhodocollybia butyracea]
MSRNVNLVGINGAKLEDLLETEDLGSLNYESADHTIRSLSHPFASDLTGWYGRGISTVSAAHMHTTHSSLSFRRGPTNGLSFVTLASLPFTPLHLHLEKSGPLICAYPCCIIIGLLLDSCVGFATETHRSSLISFSQLFFFLLLGPEVTAKGWMRGHRPRSAQKHRTLRGQDGADTGQP